MKKLFPLLLPLVLVACGYTRFAPPMERKVKIEYVLKNEDGSGEVWAKYQSPYRATFRQYYMAQFSGVIPDSLRPGKVLYLHYNDRNPDSCQCITFKLMPKK